MRFHSSIHLSYITQTQDRSEIDCWSKGRLLEIIKKSDACKENGRNTDARTTYIRRKSKGASSLWQHLTRSFHGRISVVRVSETN